MRSLVIAASLAFAASKARDRDASYAGKNTFSPSGRLLQHDYARVALERSSLCVGVACADGRWCTPSETGFDGVGGIDIRYAQLLVGGYLAHHTQLKAAAL